MKTVIIAMIFVFAYSQELTVKKSWNLLGSTEDLNTSFFRSDCANSVWTYENGSWKNFAHGKEKITSFFKIAKGQGFWVFSKDGSCSLNTDTSKNPLSRVYNPSHWVTPSKYVCKKNNGLFTSDYYTKQDICISSLNDAQKICLDSAARLPIIDELKEIIIGCGAIIFEVIDDFQANRTNETYKSCYKNLGFTNSTYWSSTIKYNEYFNKGTNLTFESAGVYERRLDSSAQVRCFGSQEVTNKLVIQPEDENIQSVLIGRIGALSSSQNKIISSKKSFQTLLDDINTTDDGSVDKSWLNTLEKSNIDFTKYNVFVYRFRQPSICSYNDTITIENGIYTIKYRMVGNACSSALIDYFLVYKIAKDIDTFVVDFFNEKEVVIKNVE